MNALDNDDMKVVMEVKLETKMVNEVKDGELNPELSEIGDVYKDEALLVLTVEEMIAAGWETSRVSVEQDVYWHCL